MLIHNYKNPYSSLIHLNLHRFKSSTHHKYTKRNRCSATVWLLIAKRHCECLEFYRRCELQRPRCRHLRLLEAQGRPRRDFCQDSSLVPRMSRTTRYVLECMHRPLYVRLRFYVCTRGMLIVEEHEMIEQSLQTPCSTKL